LGIPLNSVEASGDRVATSLSNPSAVYVTGREAIYSSANAGATWQWAGGGIVTPGIVFNALAVASDGAVVYVGARVPANAFVTKLNADLTAHQYSTYLGGRDGDSYGYAVAVDGSAAYVTGSTQARDFPTTASAYRRDGGWDAQAFVAKISDGGAACSPQPYPKASSSTSGLAYRLSPSWLRAAALERVGVRVLDPRHRRSERYGDAVHYRGSR
jgi:hypothetical protein